MEHDAILLSNPEGTPVEELFDCSGSLLRGHFQPSFGTIGNSLFYLFAALVKNTHDGVILYY
ncbi:MAG: hypothetical protein KAR13_15985, partial [Desulfobulbaceae bacterium]|nr:hypothetical protein [Desulfobulbaceae bacterium]